MTLILLFLLFFVAGPLLFRSLTRARPERAHIRRLAAVAALFCAVALVIRFLAAPAELWSGALAALVLLVGWAAWVTVLSMGALALRRAEPSARMRRWTGIIGAACTTVPWFGLAYADWKGF